MQEKKEYMITLKEGKRKEGTKEKSRMEGEKKDGM